MRFFYILLLIVALITGYFIYSPKDLTAAQECISDTYRSTVIEKRVSLRGLRTLRPDAIRARLPMDHSIPWWITNTEQVEAMLTQISFIQGADVQPCEHWFSPWGCFVIDITERSPAYLTTSGGDMLVLGADGGVIVSFPLSEIDQRLEQLLDPNAKKPKMLVDMITPGVSSDVVNARFTYLSSAIKGIEKGAEVEITRAHLLNNGELVVRIGAFPFEVQFDAPQENEDRMIDETSRLKRLLGELRGRENDIKKIDLAFDKLAVVTFTDEYLKRKATEEQNEKKKNK